MSKKIESKKNTQNSIFLGFLKIGEEKVVMIQISRENRQRLILIIKGIFKI